MKVLSPFLVLLLILTSCKGSSEELYQSMTKIDAHVHIRTGNPAIMDFSRSEGFKLITINTRSESQDYIDEQMHYARKMQKLYPQDLSYLTTFSMENFEDAGWAGRVIQKLEKDLDEGAVGVKVWKDIGMTFKDSLGQFVFLDDPLFEPILDFIAARSMPLLAHIGEPKNCWLPVDSMTVNNDKSYFSNNPQYHMYLHPEYPSYDRLIESRDHVLARHPDLKLIGAHLGSLEWDVDELAERLDRYPNFAVDLAARVCHLQVQDREKVRKFIIRYQDRIIYATDLGVSEGNFKDKQDWIENEWRSDWSYFASADTLRSSNIEDSFVGLDLNKKVLLKIFYSNALQWYPIIE